MKKARLDVLLVERGFVDNQKQAAAAIMSGNVFVDGHRASTPGMAADYDAMIELRGKKEYVSRAGHKLQKALDNFAVSPNGKICIDCGASTGGFTDCLLRYGAKLVYAVDVAYGQLALSIRNDPRVVVMERTNIRHARLDMFETRPVFAAIDVSFISLSLVLPVMRELLSDDGDVLCLIKPQFEAKREQIGDKGVIQDPQTHLEVLDAFIQSAIDSAFVMKGLTFSPIKGPEGNIEYLAWLGFYGECAKIDTRAVVFESHVKLMKDASEYPWGNEFVR